MNLRQAAQDVLELVEWIKDNLDVVRAGGDMGISPFLIDKLRAALAEPEQEPVAYFDPQEKGFYWAKPTVIKAPTTISVEPLPLYSAPTPRKPLTEPELHAITPTWPAPGQEWGYEEVLAFVRAIERAHGIGEQT